jgi:hypothetical protein
VWELLGGWIMNVRPVSFVSVFILLLSATTAVAQERVPRELAAFAERTAAEIGASPLGVPQFKSAKVDAIEDLGKIDGTDRYLCWLKTDPNRGGYIAVASDGKSFQVLAFSATTMPPAYFLRQLRVVPPPQTPIDFAHAKQLCFTPDVPLVAATETYLGTERCNISETAASLSTVLNYWQNEKKMLLFHHVGMEPSLQDQEYSRRYAENAANRLEPQDPNVLSFRKECDMALARANTRTTANGRTQEEVIASGLRRREIVTPIIRRRLLDPINAGERMSALEEERNTLARVTRMDISSRMKDAVLLQLDYIDKDPANLKKNLGVFFETRGRTARFDQRPLDQMNADVLPLILMAGGDIAGVLLGYVDVDGERFASVYFPRTGHSVRKTWAQKRQEIRLQNGLSAEPPKWSERPETLKRIEELKETEAHLREVYREKGLPDPVPQTSVEQRVAADAERREKDYSTMFVVEDLQSRTSASGEDGIHLVRYSCLSSWLALSVGEVKAGGNWGRPPSAR